MAVEDKVVTVFVSFYYSSSAFTTCVEDGNWGALCRTVIIVSV